MGVDHREGLHHRIEEMKQNMAIVEAKRQDFRRYKSFVDQIDRDLIKHSPSITARFKEQNPPPARRVTDKEVNLKLHLKAEMIRSHIPEEFRAPSPLKGDRKTLTTTTAVNQILQPKKEPIRIDKTPPPKPQAPYKAEIVNSADRKNWFIPASDKMRPLQRSIEAALAAQKQAVPQQRPSNSETQSAFSKAQERPQKTATYSQVREKVRTEAGIKRAKVPPEYRAEPYKQKDEKPYQSEHSAMKFGKAATAANEPPPKTKMSDYFNMRSAKNGQTNKNMNKKPTTEI